MNKMMDGLFKAKERFHKSMIKLPFEKKIEIFLKLHQIEKNIRPIREKMMLMKNESKKKYKKN